VWEIDEQQWQDTLDINLTGYWKTLKATIPHMLEADNGGSIILVSSVAGLKAMPVQSPYSASKHGVVGLAQTAAKELGEHRIRVNTIHPYGVLTPMGGEDPGAHDVFENMPQFLPHFTPILGMGMAKTDDITDSVMFLASEASRTITASTSTVDLGAIKVWAQWRTPRCWRCSRSEPPSSTGRPCPPRLTPCWRRPPRGRSPVGGRPYSRRWRTARAVSTSRSPGPCRSGRRPWPPPWSNSDARYRRGRTVWW